MKDRPILFSAPMVKAILEGRKTQTRRIVKRPLKHPDWTSYMMTAAQDGAMECGPDYPDDDSDCVKCPYGKPGDWLWCRETFCRLHQGLQQHLDPDPTSPYWWTAFRADGEPVDFESYGVKWKPSIFMPRKLSRLALEITEVRVQRLQEISEEDAKAEGCESIESERDEPDFSICPNCGGTGLFTGAGQNGGAIPDVDCGRCDTYVKRYRHLWESINGKGSWEANSHVWVVEFRKITK